MFVLMELINGILVKFCSSFSCYERSRNKLKYRISRLNWMGSGSKTWFWNRVVCELKINYVLYAMANINIRLYLADFPFLREEGSVMRLPCCLPLSSVTPYHGIPGCTCDFLHCLPKEFYSYEFHVL